MRSSIGSYLRRHHLALVAIFLAGTGTAVALPGKNTVDSGDIKSNAVKSADIAPGAVQGEDIAETSIDFSTVQRRVSGACGPNQAAQSVGEDGSLGCAPFPAPGNDAVAVSKFDPEVLNHGGFGIPIPFNSYVDLTTVTLNVKKPSAVFMDGATLLTPNAGGASFICAMKLDGQLTGYGDIEKPAASEGVVLAPQAAVADVQPGNHTVAFACQHTGINVSALAFDARIYAHAIPTG